MSKESKKTINRDNKNGKIPEKDLSDIELNHARLVATFAALTWLPIVFLILLITISYSVEAFATRQWLTLAIMIILTIYAAVAAGISLHSLVVIDKSTNVERLNDMTKMSMTLMAFVITLVLFIRKLNGA